MLKSNTAFLDNVCAMRLMLIVLLVMYHSFAPFTGAWEAPQGFTDMTAYWWVGKASYSCMLESFVFISGYLLGYQVMKKGQSILMFKNIAIKKAKRLWLPCVVFGIIYFALFRNWDQPLWLIAYQIINGIGHMWFLPMLFWCFIAVYLLEKLHIPTKTALPLMVLASLFSFVPLPIQMGRTMYYALFFFVGYRLAQRPNTIDKLLTLRTVIVCWLAFIPSFVVLTLVKNRGGYNDLISHIINLISANICTLTYSLLGVAALWVTINWFLKRGYIVLSQRAIQFSSMCFGVYIYQQFVLKVLYYNLNLIHTVPPLLLPWIGVAVALATSILLTRITLATRIGRYLIG